MPVFATLSTHKKTISTGQIDAEYDEMNIGFMDIGQGDCTVISCPDNMVIVVDCGTVGGLPDNGMLAIKNLVLQWAYGDDIDLILTHPDRDHYNQAINLCNYIPVTYAQNIYFSRAYSNDSPLGNYNVTALGNNMHIFNFPEIHEITINANNRTKKTWNNLNGYNAPVSNLPIAADGITIASGQTTDGTDWSIKIIAGNVPATGNDEWQSNAASLVTLISFGNQTVLLMADATSETMNYLFNNQAAQIGNVSFLQMPHHGSESNLPSNNFKNLVNPHAIIISVGLLSNNFKLPRYNAIQSWLYGANLNAEELVIDYWQVGAPGYNTVDDLNQILDVSWAPYEVDQNDTNTFFWLLDPQDAEPGYSNTGFYGFTNNGYFLYRITINRDIWATGVEGSFEHNFN